MSIEYIYDGIFTLKGQEGENKKDQVTILREANDFADALFAKQATQDARTVEVRYFGWEVGVKVTHALFMDDDFEDALKPFLPFLHDTNYQVKTFGEILFFRLRSGELSWCHAKQTPDGEWRELRSTIRIAVEGVNV